VIASAGTKNTGTKNVPVGIDSQLDKIFALYLQDRSERSSSDSDGNDDNVTPLMVACDKCCSEAFIFLRNQVRASSDHEDNLQLSPNAIPTKHIIEAWGHPTEASSCGNRAAHHALAAGFCEGLDLLDYLWDCIEKEFENDRLHRYLSLISQTNHNGDTPLMMASVSGHVAIIKHIVERIFKFALSTNSDNADAILEKTWQSIKDIFNMRNSEECAAMNLACGHGHIDTVTFLIQPQYIQVCSSNNSSFEVNLCGDNGTQKEASDGNNTTQVCRLKPLVDVSYSDVDFCEKAVENLAAGLKFMKERNQVDKIKEFHDQHMQAKECLAMLGRELERISKETADELLLENGKTDQGEVSRGFKPKRKAKKKKKQNRNNTRQSQKENVMENDVGGEVKTPDDVVGKADISNNETKHHKSWADVKDEPEIELNTHQSPTNSSPFITLQDGTIVSSPQKANDPSSIEVDNSSLNNAIPNNPTSSGTKTKSLQSILQSTSTSYSTDDDTIAAIMESLCLDPSMLLLSPHGMAMEMSPCQLEAIESILNHQLNATKEAQNIQSRLLDK